MSIAVQGVVQPSVTQAVMGTGEGDTWEATLDRGTSASFGFSLCTDSSYRCCVKATTPGGPAERAGLLRGDLVLAISGNELPISTSIAGAVRLVKAAGACIQLRLLRPPATATRKPCPNTNNVTAVAPLVTASVPSFAPVAAPLPSVQVVCNPVVVTAPRAVSDSLPPPRVSPSLSSSRTTPSSATTTSSTPPVTSALSSVPQGAAKPAVAALAVPATQAPASSKPASPSAGVRSQIGALLQQKQKTQGEQAPISALAPAKAAGTSPASHASNGAKVCAGCSKEIQLLSYIQANGLLFHERCFACSTCRADLTRSGFQMSEESNELQCRFCWQKQHGKNCTRCGHAIAPNAVGQLAIVETETEAYHLDCFTCQDCNQPLRGQDGSFCAYPIDGKLYCKPHAQIKASLQASSNLGTTASGLPVGRGRTTMERLANAMGTDYSHETKW